MSNDFIPFAVGGSANVTPQATYAANTTLTQSGFQSGLAKSPDLNKVWRQSSIMSAVVAQFVVNQTGQNAVDDGTTATLIANLLAAVRNAARQSVIVTGAGSANTYTATNAPALTALPSSGFIQQITIPAANTGASTFAPDGLTAKPILGLGNSALQGGELPANSVATLMYVIASIVNSGNGAWIILECTGGASQIAAATQANHAAQITQVQSGSASYAADTGTVNAYAAAFSPAVTAFTNGLVLRFKAANTNTGTSTFNPNGLGIFQLLGLNHLPLQGGEIIVNGEATIQWNSSLNGGNGAFVLEQCTGGNQTAGRLIGVQVFSSSATYTPSVGMTSVIVKAQGGGGGGGGITVPSAGNVSLGAPGGAGAYAEGRLTAAQIGASQAVTIGAAGTSGSGVAGGNGGTTSVGALISAPGGVGGSMLNNQVPPQDNGNGATSSNPAGANIFGCVGACQGYSLALSATFMIGGAGGTGMFGSGPAISPLNTGGAAALNPGCGGGGTAGGSGSAALVGGVATKGYVEIWEYA